MPERFAAESLPSGDLYAGFSGQARKAVHLAFQEAQRLRNDYVGTEHLLVGILQEGSPGVARLLEACGQSAEELRHKIEVLLPPGEEEVRWELLPLSPDARRSLDAARQEAARLQHASVTPEHLFLALLQQTESTAAHILSHLGLTVDTLRAALEKLPATENRDWMMGATPGTYGVRDPSPRDLAAVVSPDVLPSEMPYPAEEAELDEDDEEGPARDRRPESTTAPLRKAKRRRPSDADLDLPVVLQQLHLLQLVLVTVVAMILGGLALGVPGAGLGFFIGPLFALVIMNTRYAGAIVGMAAGMSWVMLSEGRNWGLFVAGALGGLIVGGCLGDWRKFRAPPGSGGGPADA